MREWRDLQYLPLSLLCGKSGHFRVEGDSGTAFDQAREFQAGSCELCAEKRETNAVKRIHSYAGGVPQSYCQRKRG